MLLTCIILDIVLFKSIISSKSLLHKCVSLLLGILYLTCYFRALPFMMKFLDYYVQQHNSEINNLALTPVCTSPIVLQANIKQILKRHRSSRWLITGLIIRYNILYINCVLKIHSYFDYPFN